MASIYCEATQIQVTKQNMIGKNLLIKYRYFDVLIAWRPPSSGAGGGEGWKAGEGDYTRWLGHPTEESRGKNLKLWSIVIIIFTTFAIVTIFSILFDIPIPRTMNRWKERRSWLKMSMMKNRRNTRGESGSFILTCCAEVMMMISYPWWESELYSISPKSFFPGAREPSGEGAGANPREVPGAKPG